MNKINNMSKWLGDLPDYIKNKKINEITIPGSLNSGAEKRLVTNMQFPSKSSKLDPLKCYYNTPEILPKLKNLYNNITICQKLSIREQLNIGIRFFELKVSYSEKENIYYLTNITACHNIFNVLLDISTFLDKNKSEFVILSISPDTENIDLFDKNTTINFLAKLVSLYNDRILERTNEFPTYKDMILYNKRIILYYTDPRFNITNKNFWNYDTLNNINYKSKNITESINKTSLNIFSYKEDLNETNIETALFKLESPSMLEINNLDFYEYFKENKDNLKNMSVCASYFVSKEFAEYIITLNYAFLV
jgi:hypothetical protein